MSTEGSLRLRRTVWNTVVYGRVQGKNPYGAFVDDDSAARGFSFVYSDFSESHLLNFYWLTEDVEYEPDDWDSVEDFRALREASKSAQEFIQRVEEENATEFYDGVQPWIDLSAADRATLETLVQTVEKKAGWRLASLLEPTTETVAVPVRVLDDLHNMAQLLVRDMPADEPMKLDYGFIVEES